MTLIGKFEIAKIQESDPLHLVLAAVASVDGRMRCVGGVRIEHYESQNYHGLCYILDRIYVGLPGKPGREPKLTRETRGKGIGTALHTQAINWVRERGCKVVVADVIPEHKDTEDVFVSALLRWGYELEYIADGIPRYRLDLENG